ncbi:MAG TPA: hypothetical protein VM577_16340 [Anaerovoracaceae bacterium]|nr:hypothetical protein [Anaerovoracaceae bacterium]
MSEKKTKKPAKKAPAKKTPAKKAPAKKAPAKKAPKKVVKKAPKKAPEVVQAPAVQEKEPASMRTLLTEALMTPPERKHFVGGSGRGFGNPRPPVAPPASMSNGNFRRVMDTEQMSKAIGELHMAIAQVRFTVTRAETMIASLEKEVERVETMKKEVLRGEFKKEELQAKEELQEKIDKVAAEGVPVDPKDIAGFIKFGSETP